MPRNARIPSKRGFPIRKTSPDTAKEKKTAQHESNHHSRSKFLRQRESELLPLYERNSKIWAITTVEEEKVVAEVNDEVADALLRDRIEVRSRESTRWGCLVCDRY